MNVPTDQNVPTENQPTEASPKKSVSPKKKEFRTETLIGVDLLLVDRIDHEGSCWARIVKIHRQENGACEREDISREFLVMDVGPEELLRSLEAAQKKARIHWGLEPAPRRNPPLTHRIPKAALPIAAIAEQASVEKKETSEQKRQKRQKRRQRIHSLECSERALRDAKEIFSKW